MTRKLEVKLFKIFSTILRKSIDDPILQFVSINEVTIAKDLSLANVYVSCFDAKRKKGEVIQHLTKSSGVFKSELAKLKTIRRIPEMKFIYDDTTEKAVNLSQKIEGLTKTQVEPEPTKNKREE